MYLPLSIIVYPNRVFFKNCSKSSFLSSAIAKKTTELSDLYVSVSLFSSGISMMQGGQFINQKFSTMILPARFLVFTLLSLISVVLKCEKLPPVLKKLLSFGFGNVSSAFSYSSSERR